jgi:hypothetical protein
MRILVVVPPLVALPMVVPPSSSFLSSVFEPIFGDTLMCLVVTSSELPLVEFGRIVSSHTLLKMCSAHKNKVEIKCMGSVGGKTPIEAKIYSFFSSLRHDKIDVVYIVHL